jgi:hypothetical protein
VLASRWALPVLALAAFVVSLVVQETIFAALSWNRDEPVYLWHVDVLRAGQLSTPDGGHPDLFQPWLSAARDGTLFSQYTLGWPLVLTLGALIGSPALAVAAGAALAVIGTWALVHELVRDRAVATVAAGAMLGSPILAVQGGVYLNYLFTLGLGLLFMTALLSGVRLRSRWRLAAAGALLGWVFLTRPYDAAVWGLLGAAPVVLEHRREWRRLVPSAAWTGVGLLPLVAAGLVVNQRLTGSATEFPITVADPLDQFGFGFRRLMPTFELIDYGPRAAGLGTGRNAWWLPLFLLGAHAGVVVAVGGWWAARRQRSTWVLVALGAAFPIAYFAFFGTHISSLTARLSGPIYYVPAYTALCGLLAIAIVHLIRTRPSWALAVVGLLVVVTVPVSANRLAINRDLSQANAPWRDSLDAVDGRAIVVPSPPGYLLYVNPFGDNGANLDGRMLFAADNGPELLDVIAEHPDRTPYLQRADLSSIDLLPSEHPTTPRVTLTRLEVLDGPVHLVGRVEPVDGKAATAVWIEVDGRVALPVEHLSGPQEIDFDLADLAMTRGLHTVEVRLGAGGDRGQAATSPIVRRTFYVRAGDGTFEVLAPGTAARYVQREEEAPYRWEEALTVPELPLDAALRAGPDEG